MSDPCDMGALLTAALEAAGITPAEVARRTGIAPPNISRALKSPDTRAPTVRAILEACGARFDVVAAKKRRRAP